MLRNGKWRKKQKGQVLLEYAVVLIFIIIISAALTLFAYYFSQYGKDRQEWVGIDYP